jgi:type I restriction enzyme S subunit
MPVSHRMSASPTMPLFSEPLPVNPGSRVKGIGSAELGAARTPRINIRDLADIRVKVPALQIQADELERLRRAVDDIGTLIAETEKFIELARERRSALITATVTGQLDIAPKLAR